MKKLITIILFLPFILSSYLSVASDMQQRGPGGQMQSSWGMHMMSHDMMRNMTGAMQEMHLMTRDMQRIMEHRETMDQARMHEMSQVMEQLSQAMHTMSKHMADNDVDEDEWQEMHQHMKRIRHMFDNMMNDTN